MDMDEGAFAPGPTGAFYHLTHGSLWPHQLLVRTPTENTAFISGVFSWGEVCFAPPIVVFSPPVWLWKPQFLSHPPGDSRTRMLLMETAHEAPTNPESKEVKHLFNLAVGDAYMKMVYSQNAEAVRMFWHLVYGPLEAPDRDSDLLHILNEINDVWLRHRRLAECRGGEYESVELYERTAWIRSYDHDHPDRSGE